MHNNRVCVAIFVGDRLLDASNDVTAVRAAAALMASACPPVEPVVFQPIAAGRRCALELVADGAA